MPRTILIVDDNRMNRLLLQGVLSKEYVLIEAENGEEALAALRRGYKHIAAVLLDLMMPVMDGFAVLEQMHQDPTLAAIPVIVTSGHTDAGAESRALRLGANDYITKPYDPAIVLHRLHNTIHLRETAATINALQRDRLTGLLNRDSFFERAAGMIAAHEAGYYVLACFDIDSFKVVNDQRGTEVGDSVLRHIARTFRTGFEPIGGICGRIMADNYAVLYPARHMDAKAVTRIREEAANIPALSLVLHFSIGRYVVDDLSLPVSAMFDRAALAQASVKGRYDRHVAVYDESMRAHLLEEQQIVTEMKQALASGQFEAWFQPQYNHATQARVGAEALVRWRHPERGLIPPGVFIPIFERNGFVYEVDQCVWEQVCALLRRWIDAGLDPLPVSVNVSRYDLFREDLTDVLSALIAKYRVPIDLLRLEITESAFSQSAAQIIRVVRRLIDLGFTVEIDDFGSGYSSLNTLKDVPASILKLDMKFLESTENSLRGGNIVESIVRMAKWLGMSVIAEGVERKEQADYLSSIGCNYIQGYYYARPMPVADYEALADTAKESRMTELETVEMLDNNTFWAPESMDTLIFNSYVGGASIFEYHAGRIDLLRANKKYAQVLGGAGFSVEDALRFRWGEHMDRADAQCALELIQHALQTGEETSGELRINDLPKPGDVACLHASMRVIARTGDRALIYCTIENLTTQRLAELRERATAEQMRIIMNNMNGGVSAVTFAPDGGIRFVFANEQYFRILGLHSHEAIDRATVHIAELVHPDDVDAALAQARSVLETGRSAQYDYRCVKPGGEIAYIHCSASSARIEGIDGPVLLSVISDETELAAAQREIAETTAQLHAIMQNINGGVSAAVLGEDRAVRYLFTNERYFAMLGYTREQFLTELATPYDAVHPDDRARVAEASLAASREKRPISLTYRVIRRDGSVAWLMSNISITSIKGVEQPVQIAVANDITAQMLAERKQRELSVQLQAIIQNINGGMVATTYEDGRTNIIYANDMFYTMFGYTREQFERELADGLTSRILPEDMPLLEGRSRSERVGVASTIEYRVRRRDDSVVWVRSSSSSCRLEGIERPVHITVLNDVTSEKAAAEELRRSGERIRALNEGLTDMMNDTPGGFARMRLLPDNRVMCLYANKVFCDLLDTPHDELMAHCTKDAYWSVHPEDAPMLRAAVAQMRRSGEARSVKARLRRRGGDYIWLMLFMRLTQSGDGEVFINTYYADLSAQLRHEAQQKELLDNLPCGAALLELDGNSRRIVYLNRRYHELVGRDAASAPDMSVDTAVRPDDLPRLLEEARAAIRENRDIACDVHLRYGTDGSYRAFHAAGRLIRRGDGAYSVYATFTRISEGEMSLQETLPFVLDAIMEYSSDLTFAKDRDLRYLCCSRPFARLAGLERASDVIGKTDYDLFPKDIADHYHADDLALMAGGAPLVDALEALPSVDGRARYASTSKIALLDTLGNPIGVYGLSRDVTESRAASDQLRLLTESIPGGLAAFEVSESGFRTLYYNDGFYRYSGYGAEEYAAIVAGDPYGLVLAEDRPILEEAITRLCKGRSAVASGVFRCRTKDGGKRWLSMRGRISERRPGATVLSVVQFDITEQKESEERLRVSEELFRAAASLGDRTVARYDVPTGVIRHSSELLRQLGFGDVIRDVPQTFIDAGLVHPSSVESLLDLYARVRQGERLVSRTLSLKGADGGFRWFELSATTSLDERGKPAEALIVLRDVTEQRERETVYRKWKQSLAERSEDSYTLFRCNLSKNASFDCVEGALLHIEFASGADSFDGRTKEYVAQCVHPDDRERYTAALNADTLLANYYRGKRTETIEYRDTYGGSARWLRLTIDLVEYPDTSDVEAYLMYETIEAEKQAELTAQEQARTDPLTGALNRRAFQERMEEIIRIAGAGAQQALMLLDVDGFKQVNDTFGHGVGDRTLTEIAAALRSTLDEGDLLGRLGGDEFLIGVKDARDDAAVIGKARQICALARRTLGPDVQLSASIGVALCPQDGGEYEALYRKADIALYHVKGTGKDGYAFYGTEMEAEAAMLSLGARPRQAAGGAKPRRMLIVDDNEMNCTFLTGVFQEEFMVETARSGSEALVWLHRYGASLSVMLLDLMMPGLDGFAVLDKMRGSPEMQQIPVIVVSGASERDVSLRAIRAGAADFVTKPIDPELIRLRVQSAISRRENERLRVQNSLLLMQRDEVVKYQTVVESAGTIVVQLKWVDGTFSYDRTIGRQLAGSYDARSLWHIFLLDAVTDAQEVQRMQTLVQDVANDRERTTGGLTVTLKTREHGRQTFRMKVYKLTDAAGLADQLILTFDAEGSGEA